MRWSYWNGPDEEDRRVKYAKDFKPEYQSNGDDVQRRIDAVVAAFRAETGVELPEGYSSGWRPPVVNDATRNSAKGTSTHLSANAGDKRDAVNGEFAWWCMRNVWVLERHQLYMEHPIATVVRAWRTAKAQDREPTPWCHQQSVPPRSHSRVYFPDTASVREWEQFTQAGGKAGMSYQDWLILEGAVKKRSE